MIHFARIKCIHLRSAEVVDPGRGMASSPMRGEQAPH